MTSIEILIKPVSSSCNMSCDYCFYNDVSDNRHIKNYGLMSESTYKNIIDKANDEVSEGMITYAFQGGEPLLAGLDFFKGFILYAQSKKTSKINYVIQTNGLSINKEWVTLFRENNFLVGLSIDGIKPTHNLSRLDHKDDPTYRKVLKASELLIKEKVRVNILTVVDDIITKKVRSIYASYKKLGFKYLQFIPMLEPLESNNTRSLSPQLYDNFMIQLFDLWYKDLFSQQAMSIRFFDNILSMYLGHEPESCVMRGECSFQYVVEADGSVFPCDFYVLDDFDCGNINETTFKRLSETSAAVQFLSTSENYKECMTCQWFNLCRNGCKRYRVEGQFKYCDSYKLFFEHANEKFQLLTSKIRRGVYR